MRRVALVLTLATGCAPAPQPVTKIVATPIPTATPEPTPVPTPIPTVVVVRTHRPEPGLPRRPNSTAGGTCTASWYAAGLVAPEDLTAASRDYPRGTRLRVTHDDKSVVVRVNDYGPAVWTGRCIDLSRGAFRALASPSVGLIDVTVEVA